MKEKQMLFEAKIEIIKMGYTLKDGRCLLRKKKKIMC